MILLSSAAAIMYLSFLLVDFTIDLLSDINDL